MPVETTERSDSENIEQNAAVTQTPSSDVQVGDSTAVQKITVK